MSQKVHYDPMYGTVVTISPRAMKPVVTGTDVWACDIEEHLQNGLSIDEIAALEPTVLRHVIMRIAEVEARSRPAVPLS